MSRWKKVKIGDLLLRSKIPIDIEDQQEYKRVTIRTKHQGVSLRDKEIGKQIGTKKQFILKSGQFLMSKIDARYGAFGIAGDDVESAIITGNFWAYDINQDLTTVEWINKYTNSPDFYELCERASSGVTHRRYLNEQTFLNHELFIPSIDEQFTILRLNHQKTKLINNLKAELNNQEKYISQLKQAILQEAIAGQLTADWRKQNPMQKGNPDTDAAALLAKIKTEKQQLIADGKLKKEKPLAEIAIDEIPFSIPNNWVWCRTENICFAIVDCPHSTPKYKDEGENCIDTTCFDEEGIIKKARKVDQQTFIERNQRLEPLEGDIVYSREGIIGQAVILPDNQKFCLGQRVMLFRPWKPIQSKMFRLIIVSPFFRQQMTEKHKGMGAKHVNMVDLRSGIIPLPPLAEQKAIVEKVDKLMNIIDQLEQQIKHRKQIAEALMQTVLREAFE